MLTYRKFSISFFLIIINISGCVNYSGDINDYAQTVKQELAKGTRKDSLFLGVKFGMSSKEFFAHCWELNKKGIITDGANNTAVLYKISDGLKHPATINFYPEFHLDKMYKMKATFQYDAWAPWNKSHFSDSLLTDIIQLYKNWYQGNQFIKMTDDVRGTIYVKVDGNRRITIGRYDDMIVKVDYTDLIMEQRIKNK